MSHDAAPDPSSAQPHYHGEALQYEKASFTPLPWEHFVGKTIAAIHHDDPAQEWSLEYDGTPKQVQITFTDGSILILQPDQPADVDGYAIFVVQGESAARRAEREDANARVEARVRAMEAKLWKPWEDRAVGYPYRSCGDLDARSPTGGRQYETQQRQHAATVAPVARRRLPRGQYETQQRQHAATH